MNSKREILLVATVFCASCAVAAELPKFDAPTTSRCGEKIETFVAQRLSASAFADVESAYWARGAIVDKKPFSAQFADLSFNLDPFGRVGGYAWSVSSLAKSGQSVTRRNAYNEVDYAVYYGYGLELAEEWTLDTTIAKKWVTLPGYRPHANTISEWNVSQSLKNPYVTPYYLLRRAYNGQKWCYWDVGLTRSWNFLDDFTFTATAFGEFGDSRHFAGALAALSDAGIRAPQDVRIATWANKGNVPIYARALSRIEIDPWKNAAQTYAFCRAALSGDCGAKPPVLAPSWIAGETI